MSITVLLAALALILWPGPAVGDDVSNSAEIETAVSLRVRMLAKARRAQTVPLTLLQVQNNLAGLAYIEFQDVDGQMGPRTISAIRRFREDHCLPPIAAEPDMGVALDPLTDQHLRMMVTAVQLAVNGRNPQANLVIDGLYGPKTKAAVQAIQTASQPFYRPQLPIDGAVDDSTAGFLDLSRTVPGCPCQQLQPPAATSPTSQPPLQPLGMPLP